MLLCPWIAAFAVCLPTSQAKKASEDQAAHLSLLSVTEWAALVERDRRATFALRTVPEALRELEREESSERAKCAAVLALGYAKATAERPRIQALADNSKGELKSAAIWALGALGTASDVAKLIDFAGRRAAVAEAGLVGLALNGTGEALAHVRGLAADEANPLARVAKDAVGLVSQPPQESELARAVLELRFDAARRFGLIDGQAWEVLIVDDLAKHQKFLSRVIYRAGSEVRRPGIRDHYLEIALAGAPPERLRGVVNALPTELAQLIENDLFRPLDDKEWGVLVDEIVRRGLEPLTEAVLREAFTIPALRDECAAALARGGARGAMLLLDVAVRSDDEGERAHAARALGEAGGETSLPTLAALEDDAAPKVRAEALVARARLGDPKALSLLRARLGLDEAKPRQAELHADASALVESLTRVAGDPRIRDLVLALSARAPLRVRFELAVELALAGHEESKALVRETLRNERPSGAVGARAIAALAKDARAEDVALARELFPLGDDLDVDVELACFLIRAKDAEILPLLRSALWSEPWNRSIVSGALWVEVLGIDGLRLELGRPPSGSSPRDVRRVGFALGEWGGMAQVDWLSARVGAADPALQGAVLGALGARTH
ncbi:MAG: HEAT repeat domain-containing protein [Planctomycetes bacterium]|nr:HEAT repeat domain-containing protein [Planctomycetota bacterium]